MFNNSLQLTKTKKISNEVNKSLQKINNETLVIIPCFNEGKNIEKTVESLKQKTNLEFIIIDDCSTDNSLEIIKKNNWNYLHNDKNLGLSKSFSKGVKYAKEKGYKYIIQFDGDGQHNPEDLNIMLYYAKKGYDIVLTSRYYSKNNLTYSKKIAHKILNFLFKLRTKQTITDATCGLRIFNWIVMDEFINNSKMEVEPSAIAYITKKQKLKLKEVPTTVFERENGTGSFSKKSKIIKYMIRQINRLVFLSLNKGKKSND